MKNDNQKAHDRYMKAVTQLIHEEHATDLMRQQIAFTIGFIRREQPEIAETLERLLDDHTAKKKELSATLEG